MGSLGEFLAGQTVALDRSPFICFIEEHPAVARARSTTISIGEVPMGELRCL